MIVTRGMVELSRMSFLLIHPEDEPVKAQHALDTPIHATAVPANDGRAGQLKAFSALEMGVVVPDVPSGMWPGTAKDDAAVRAPGTARHPRTGDCSLTITCQIGR